MSNFTFTLYRKGPRGLEEVVLTIDQNLVITGEASKTVESYSMEAAGRAFSDSMLKGSTAVRDGMIAEREERNKRIAAVMIDEQTKKKTVVPTSAGVLAAQILLSEPCPCVTPACKKIRADFDAALAEAKKAGCPTCKQGDILAEYQNKIIEAGISL